MLTTTKTTPHVNVITPQLRQNPLYTILAIRVFLILASINRKTPMTNMSSKLINTEWPCGWGSPTVARDLQPHVKISGLRLCARTTVRDQDKYYSMQMCLSHLIFPLLYITIQNDGPMEWFGSGQEQLPWEKRGA